ncbi:PREDICTED: FGFR1 oncogene partner-like [Amphimedon queenslandica]|uniref:FGFR1 oncogene partner (FOP) N-terminal dimerisation domain-containing protein n=1 Tax=Amphimedon queenslandica TaxID=400682 RepID=A0A1X7VJK3_AMPQE|nr:PREDICTED: FGFR1 oncogene partner-like [Amphimedon queenslandica]|eukprot:XP_011410111.1 PREDICTED: FGFR1 oncogene partner-like [Amphimedon queenslandica]
MAGEEDDDVELRDLVAQTLESQGVLGSIRAQLRASVVLALEEQESKTKPHSLVNKRLTSFLKTKDGQITVGLVREFLEFFELDFTCSVFDPETNVLKSYKGRNQLAADIGLKDNTDTPLLHDVLQQLRNASPTPATPPHLTPSSIPSATPVTMATPVTIATPITMATISSIPPPAVTPISSIPSLKQPEVSAVKPLSSNKGNLFADSKFLVSEGTGLTGGGSDVLARLLDSNSKDPPGTNVAKGVESGEDSEEEDNTNLKYETTDHSLSQASAGDFDYSEQIQ